MPVEAGKARQCLTVQSSAGRGLSRLARRCEATHGHAGRGDAWRVAAGGAAHGAAHHGAVRRGSSRRCKAGRARPVWASRVLATPSKAGVAVYGSACPCVVQQSGAGARLARRCEAGPVTVGPVEAWLAVPVPAWRGLSVRVPSRLVRVQSGPVRSRLACRLTDPVARARRGSFLHPVWNALERIGIRGIKMRRRGRLGETAPSLPSAEEVRLIFLFRSSARTADQRS